MLEGLVANLLNRVMGMYVRNFDPKQLRVGIWSGDVQLQNLELRREALDQLHLPLNVVEGHVGQLTVSIPWSALRTKPVRINVEDVFILAAPKEDADYDADDEEQRVQRLKMEKLDSAELLKERNTEGMSKEEQQKQQGFAASLTTAIIDNLQITVKSIHVRYEDSISAPGHPFAAGLTLGGFSAVSTDENYQPTFIQSTSGSTHKMAELEALAIYWNTDTKLLGSNEVGAKQQGLEHGELLEQLKGLIAKPDDETISKHQYILKPVSGQARVEMDKTGKTDRPKVKASLVFGELGFILDEDQYRDALMLVDLFHYVIRHQEYKKLQPKSSPKEDPRAWLKFAGTAVLDRIHDRNRRWTWDYYKERRDDRRKYIDLFKKRKKEEKLTPEEKFDIDELEKKLTYEDLRFWRSLARNQLKRENVGVSSATPEKQTWSSWIWGGGNKQTDQPADDSQMSVEQREELYSAIDFDEKKALAEAVELPKESVKMQVDLALKMGSFTLKRDPQGKAYEILKLLFEDFYTSFLQRPESFLAEVSLKDMRMIDGTTKGSLYPEIITVKDSPKIKQNEDDESESNFADVDSPDNKSSQRSDRFFQLSFENNPLDGSADSAVTIHLKAMEIIYNPRFVVDVAKFFKPPETHMESIGALMETANATVEGIRKQTRAGLEFALEEHKTINAHFDLQAPLIIIPDSVTQEDTLCMIVDAGHIGVSSELVDKDTLKEVQSKQTQQYTDADYRRLEGLMYDKFLLKLDSTQVLIGPSIMATRAQLNTVDSSRNLHIVNRINMDFTVETCIVPKGTDLTKFRITGNLPVLHASISDAKYKNLMRLLDVAIPKFNDQPTEDKPASDPRQTSKSLVEDLNVGLTRRRAKSFQFSSQEHELLMEDEPNTPSEQFDDASQGDQSSDKHIDQRNFEFKFTVDKLRGSLYRADPEGKAPDELLADLIAEGFSLHFYQRPFDIVAEVGLKTLTLEDHVEESPALEFKNIVSSEALNDEEQKDLFQLKFVKVNPESPNFMSEYEGIALNLDVSVSTINLIVTRKTLLTLLDFVLNTFTSPGNGSSEKAIELPEKQETDREVSSVPPASTDKIRIRAELKRIAMILNNDGIRLATLSLNTANIGIFLAGGTMRVGAKLGNMSLIDDINQGASAESSLRQLITIQGDELADFSYETFNAESETYPGHDIAILLRTGSLKVSFVPEPFRKIMEFGVKFGKMQAIFNAARQAAANQASQMQERASKMHFDILIKTPILVFPRMVVNDKPNRDLLTLYLGEIYANNKFVPLDDSEDSDTANQLSVGVRNTRMTSLLNYAEDKSEELELLDKLDIGFDINYVEHKPGYKRPDIEVKGTMSNINLRITQLQLRLVLELSKSIPGAFATEATDAVEEDVVNELPDSVVDPAKTEHGDKGENATPESPVVMSPELGTDPDKWTKIDLVFEVDSIGLEMMNASDEEPLGDLENASLSQFSFNETKVKLRMVSDGSLESELLVQSFTIKDTRKKEANRFRKIMSLINTEVSQQFMATINMSGGNDRHMIAILTVDSPRIILALDYLFAVQKFLNSGLKTPDALEIEDDANAEENDTASENESYDSTEVSSRKLTTSDKVTKASEGMAISFRVNMIAAQVVLIANPTSLSSEAIVLGIKQVFLAQQHATTLQVEKVGMFLCRMDQFETNRLRVLDDFNVSTSLDTRSQGSDSTITTAQVDIEPLVLRLSLRDVLLVMQIVNKASALQEKPESEDQEKQISTKSSPSHVRKPSTAHKRVASTGKTAISNRSRRSSIAVAKSTGSESMILKREEMNVHLEGFRLVLIGDPYELPILDWSVKGFGIDVNDWSGAMTADTNIEAFMNIYNFSKSAWEPLLEPWQFGFHISKGQDLQGLSAELYSRKPLELTLTSATIALASKAAQFLSTDEDILSKPRKTDAPYRICNYTGFTLDVWAPSDDDKEGSAAKLTDGEETPWRFEDPTTTRETLSTEGNTGIVGIRLEDSGFDSVEKIAVNREGETLYNLHPKKDRVLHRLLVDVKLGADNIKNITFRSPLLVENNTQIPVEIGVFSPEEGHLLKIEKIAPGDSRPSPVGAAFLHSLVFRPDQGFGYTWSNERVFWKNLLKKPTSTISCRGETDDSSPPFYFQMNAVYDKNHPLTSIYPYMRIRLSAPVELQNLLPYDFTYRIYDKHTKKDWTNFLRKGGVSPVHVVNISHMLLISVDMQDTPFRQSEFAIINAPSSDFSRETALVLKDTKDLALRLKLYYQNVPDSGGAFKVTVHSPYVILNKSGYELDVRSKAYFGSAKAAAGQGIFANQNEDATRAKPFMFSFPTDDQKNRALIKLGDSGWSKPQSFNAIGSSYDVTVPASSGKSEMHVGITVEQGEGKYQLTNVVTVAPRFVIKNKIGEDIHIREPGSSDITTLKNGSLHPLGFMRQTAGQQLSLCFPGLNNQWSSSFHISNVGRVHVKIARHAQRQQLVRVETLMEGATLFVHLNLTKHWPFSIRNQSDTEFFFYQANPNIDEDEDDRGSGWRPIRYRLPARSIMPYAWDYPASKNKDLILDFSGRLRTVKLAEIGQQIPLKLPPASGSSRQKIIDIDVVADGPKQNLVLSNWKPSMSLYRQKSSSTSQSTNVGFEVKDQDTDVTFKAQVRLAGVGISLINTNIRELLYVTLRDIELKYNESALYQTVNGTIKWIQIDNQLYGGIFPILLYPSVVPKTGKELEAHPIFHAAITRVKDDSYGVLYIKYFTVLLQQMTLEVDEDFIFALLDFAKVPGASWAEVKEGKLCDEELDIPEPKLEQQDQEVYFELLHLQPMQIDLSFVRTERINAEDTMTSSNPFTFAVNVMTMSLGNVNDAPLRYNALLLENARISWGTLIANIQSHYVQESLRQVHIVLGSADFLGNPVGLFNNVSAGVADIFYEPYQGLVMTDRPQDLGIGIAKGASSFVKKSVFGVSDSMAKFTGSLSKGLAAATLDKEFQDQRRMARARNRPKHALYGITSGGNAFANSLASGIGGLARHPLEGAEKEGIAGFAKGVGKGFLGLATKPAIGAFDLASNLAEGVRNTTTVFDQEGLDRVRLTRFIGQDGIVRPYTQREALGQFWLKTLDNGRSFNEQYIAHLELPGKEMLVMLTYNGIMLVRSKKLHTEWDVPLKDIQRISKERTGMNITLKEGRNGPFIPVQDESSRNWLYRQIAVAVNAYNEKWNAKG